MYIRCPKGSKANPASASDSKNPNLQSPIGQPHGSGCRQCKAASQAAERAAMGSRCIWCISSPVKFFFLFIFHFRHRITPPHHHLIPQRALLSFLSLFFFIYFTNLFFTFRLCVMTLTCPPPAPPTRCVWWPPKRPPLSPWHVKPSSKQWWQPGTFLLVLFICTLLMTLYNFYESEWQQEPETWAQVHIFFFVFLFDSRCAFHMSWISFFLFY